MKKPLILLAVLLCASASAQTAAPTRAELLDFQAYATRLVTAPAAATVGGRVAPAPVPLTELPGKLYARFGRDFVFVSERDGTVDIVVRITSHGVISYYQTVATFAPVRS